MSSYKVVIVGGGGVGKSAITFQFIYNKFIDFYDPTIEDSYRKSIDVDEMCVVLDILDTAGQEEFSSMRDHYIIAGDGFILVYSITSEKSFQEIEPLYQQIDRLKEGEMGMVLCGNKCDLEDMRKIEKTEAQEMASKIGAAFFETSAKEKINCDEVFFQVVRELQKNLGETKVKRRGGTCKIL
eukprot:TRINITY_DN5826_c0_g1_i1.p1 TRINITY_DN5826_c0_g1~~TRINITY_DN5826_c0_g1_i1.p1  ORF type:complete len:183 (-),score=51.13 TRINITY_DN5826_c0_g1_i1:45-593(-)